MYSKSIELNNKSWTCKEIIAVSAALIFVLFVHNAVPFLMLPTLGQAVWSMGFAQSFANNSLFDFYVHDFGVPKPAAMAFGLAGAWPASLLIRLGWAAADAYSGMAALWLGLAMFSAYQIARGFGATRFVAIFGGVAWMTMPIIWVHAGYSMLSLGIALLSFYFLAAINLLLIKAEANQITPTTIAIYFAATIVSIFMDGYTFMMFAVGASILLLYLLITQPHTRALLIRVAVPTHVASFALAYFLFSAYIGQPGFAAHSIDFFRGWGLDLSFLAIPTQGLFWLPDLLGLSLTRSNELYFGDSSVWKTTYALPALLFGLVAWWYSKKRHINISTGIFLVAAFSFYMALGPSLKINSTKPKALQLSHPREFSELMAPEFALIPTGNAWISRTLPGFNVMRASYRWSALGIFALWLLVIVWTSYTDKKNRRLWLLGLLVLILFNVPNLEKKMQSGINHRDKFLEIDKDLVSKLRQNISSAEMVAFIPWGNDFMANYLAPKVGFRTFNIGGDKNLLAAQAEWPTQLLALSGDIDSKKALLATKMLIDGTADTLVLPYIHMLRSPHFWPCIDQPIETNTTLDDIERIGSPAGPQFSCPSERRAELRPVIDTLRALPYIDVSDSPLFAEVRLTDRFSTKESRKKLLSNIIEHVQYPIVIGADHGEIAYLLEEGWHSIETHHVWSHAGAKLTLPVPALCKTTRCDAVLKFITFGASAQRPVSIMFSSEELIWKWNKQITAISGDTMEVRIPLIGAQSSRSISISIANAISPVNLGISSDARTLGIALQRIELER